MRLAAVAAAAAFSLFIRSVCKIGAVIPACFAIAWRVANDVPTADDDDDDDEEEEDDEDDDDDQAAVLEAAAILRSSSESATNRITRSREKCIRPPPPVRSTALEITSTQKHSSSVGLSSAKADSLYSRKNTRGLSLL